MTNSCCQLPSLRMQYCNVFAFCSQQQWKYPHASFPLARKATGMSGSIFSPFAAMLHKRRSTEKGKIWCEFMGKRGKTSERAVPKPSQPPQRNPGGWWLCHFSSWWLQCTHGSLWAIFPEIPQKVNLNDFNEGCCPFWSGSQTLQFLCRMLEYLS